MKEVREFINHLEVKGLDVVYESELFSTMQAERIQGQRTDIDASAAAVILQSYLDRIKKRMNHLKTLEEIQNTGMNNMNNTTIESAENGSNNDVTYIVNPNINFDDFKKLKWQCGKVLSAEKLENHQNFLSLV